MALGFGETKSSKQNKILKEKIVRKEKLILLLKELLQVKDKTTHDNISQQLLSLRSKSQETNAALKKELFLTCNSTKTFSEQQTLDKKTIDELSVSLEEKRGTITHLEFQNKQLVVVAQQHEQTIATLKESIKTLEKKVGTSNCVFKVKKRKSKDKCLGDNPPTPASSVSSCPETKPFPQPNVISEGLLTPASSISSPVRQPEGPTSPGIEWLDLDSRSNSPSSLLSEVFDDTLPPLLTPIQSAIKKSRVDDQSCPEPPSSTFGNTNEPSVKDIVNVLKSDCTTSESTEPDRKSLPCTTANLVNNSDQSKEMDLYESNEKRKLTPIFSIFDLPIDDYKSDGDCDPNSRIEKLISKPYPEHENRDTILHHDLNMSDQSDFDNEINCQPDVVSAETENSKLYSSTCQPIDQGLINQECDEPQLIKFDHSRNSVSANLLECTSECRSAIETEIDYEGKESEKHAFSSRSSQTEQKHDEPQVVAVDHTRNDTLSDRNYCVSECSSTRDPQIVIKSGESEKHASSDQSSQIRQEYDEPQVVEVNHSRNGGFSDLIECTSDSSSTGNTEINLESKESEKQASSPSSSQTGLGNDELPVIEDDHTRNDGLSDVIDCVSECSSARYPQIDIENGESEKHVSSVQSSLIGKEYDEPQVVGVNHSRNNGFSDLIECRSDCSSTGNTEINFDSRESEKQASSPSSTVLDCDEPPVVEDDHKRNDGLFDLSSTRDPQIDIESRESEKYASPDQSSQIGQEYDEPQVVEVDHSRNEGLADLIECSSTKDAEINLESRQSEKHPPLPRSGDIGLEVVHTVRMERTDELNPSSDENTSVIENLESTCLQSNLVSDDCVMDISTTEDVENSYQSSHHQTLITDREILPIPSPRSEDSFHGFLNDDLTDSHLYIETWQRFSPITVVSTSSNKEEPSRRECDSQNELNASTRSKIDCDDDCENVTSCSLEMEVIGASRNVQHQTRSKSLSPRKTQQRSELLVLGTVSTLSSSLSPKEGTIGGECVSQSKPNTPTRLKIDHNDECGNVTSSSNEISDNIEGQTRSTNVSSRKRRQSSREPLLQKTVSPSNILSTSPPKDGTIDSEGNSVRTSSHEIAPGNVQRQTRSKSNSAKKSPEGKAGQRLRKTPRKIDIASPGVSTLRTRRNSTLEEDRGFPDLRRSTRINSAKNTVLCNLFPKKSPEPFKRCVKPKPVRSIKKAAEKTLDSVVMSRQSITPEENVSSLSFNNTPGITANPSTVKNTLEKKVKRMVKTTKESTVGNESTSRASTSDVVHEKSNLPFLNKVDLPGESGIDKPTLDPEVPLSFLTKKSSSEPSETGNINGTTGKINYSDNFISHAVSDPTEEITIPLGKSDPSSTSVQNATLARISHLPPKVTSPELSKLNAANSKSENEASHLLKVANSDRKAVTATPSTVFGQLNDNCETPANSMPNSEHETLCSNIPSLRGGNNILCSASAAIHQNLSSSFSKSLYSGSTIFGRQNLPSFSDLKSCGISSSSEDNSHWKSNANFNPQGARYLTHSHRAAVEDEELLQYGATGHFLISQLCSSFNLLSIKPSRNDDFFNFFSRFKKETVQDVDEYPSSCLPSRPHSRTSIIEGLSSIGFSGHPTFTKYRERAACSNESYEAGSEVTIEIKQEDAPFSLKVSLPAGKPLEPVLGSLCGMVREVQSTRVLFGDQHLPRNSRCEPGSNVSMRNSCAKNYQHTAGTFKEPTQFAYRDFLDRSNRSPSNDYLFNTNNQFKVENRTRPSCLQANKINRSCPSPFVPLQSTNYSVFSAAESSNFSRQSSKFARQSNYSLKASTHEVPKIGELPNKSFCRSGSDILHSPSLNVGNHFVDTGPLQPAINQIQPQNAIPHKKSASFPNDRNNPTCSTNSKNFDLIQPSQPFHSNSNLNNNLINHAATINPSISGCTVKSKSSVFKNDAALDAVEQIGVVVEKNGVLNPELEKKICEKSSITTAKGTDCGSSNTPIVLEEDSQANLSVPPNQVPSEKVKTQSSYSTPILSSNNVDVLLMHSTKNSNKSSSDSDDSTFVAIGKKPRVSRSPRKEVAKSPTPLKEQQKSEIFHCESLRKRAVTVSPQKTVVDVMNQTTTSRMLRSPIISPDLGENPTDTITNVSTSGYIVKSKSSVLINDVKEERGVLIKENGINHELEMNSCKDSSLKTKWNGCGISDTPIICEDSQANLCATPFQVPSEKLKSQSWQSATPILSSNDVDILLTQTTINSNKSPSDSDDSTFVAIGKKPRVARSPRKEIGKLPTPLKEEQKTEVYSCQSSSKRSAPPIKVMSEEVKTQSSRSTIILSSDNVDGLLKHSSENLSKSSCKSYDSAFVAVGKKPRVMHSAPLSEEQKSEVLRRQSLRKRPIMGSPEKSEVDANQPTPPKVLRSLEISSDPGENLTDVGPKKGRKQVSATKISPRKLVTKPSTAIHSNDENGKKMVITDESKEIAGPVECSECHLIITLCLCAIERIMTEMVICPMLSPLPDSPEPFDFKSPLPMEIDNINGSNFENNTEALPVAEESKILSSPESNNVTADSGNRNESAGVPTKKISRRAEGNMKRRKSGRKNLDEIMANDIHQRNDSEVESGIEAEACFKDSVNFNVSQVEDKASESTVVVTKEDKRVCLESDGDLTSGEDSVKRKLRSSTRQPESVGQVQKKKSSTGKKTKRSRGQPGGKCPNDKNIEDVEAVPKSSMEGRIDAGFISRDTSEGGAIIKSNCCEFQTYSPEIKGQQDKLDEASLNRCSDEDSVEELSIKSTAQIPNSDAKVLKPKNNPSQDVENNQERQIADKVIPSACKAEAVSLEKSIDMLLESICPVPVSQVTQHQIEKPNLHNQSQRFRNCTTLDSLSHVGKFCEKNSSVGCSQDVYRLGTSTESSEALDFALDNDSDAEMVIDFSSSSESEVNESTQRIQGINCNTPSEEIQTSLNSMVEKRTTPSNPPDSNMAPINHLSNLEKVVPEGSNTVGNNESNHLHSDETPKSCETSPPIHLPKFYTAAEEETIVTQEEFETSKLVKFSSEKKIYSKLYSDEEIIPCSINILAFASFYDLQEAEDSTHRQPILILGSSYEKHKNKIENCLEEFFKTRDLQSGLKKAVSTLLKMNGSHIGKALCSVVGASHNHVVQEEKMTPTSFYNKTQKRAVLLVTTLANGRFEYFNDILNAIEECLIPSIHAPNSLPVNVVTNIAALYALICRTQGFGLRAQSFIYDLLYGRHISGFRVIFQILLAIPQAIPFAKEMMGPLTYTIVYIIMKQGIYNSLPPNYLNIIGVTPLRKRLSIKYGYSFSPDITRDTVMEQLMSNVMVKGCDKAIILLSKSQGYKWTFSVIQKYIFPVIDKWLNGEEADEDLVAQFIRLIGLVSRCFAVSICESFVSAAMVKFRGIIDKNPSLLILEATTEALVHFKRLNPEGVIKLLSSWTPHDHRVTKSCVRTLKNLIREKPRSYWNQFTDS